MSRLAAVADQLEPAAAGLIGHGGEQDDRLVALASIAISLRRIADRLDQPKGDDHDEHA